MSRVTQRAVLADEHRGPETRMLEHSIDVAALINGLGFPAFVRGGQHPSRVQNPGLAWSPATATTTTNSRQLNTRAHQSATPSWPGRAHRRRDPCSAGFGQAEVDRSRPPGSELGHLRLDYDILNLNQAQCLDRICQPPQKRRHTIAARAFGIGQGEVANGPGLRSTAHGL